MWVKIRVDGHIRFSFPIPFYIFQELLDCLLDLLAFVSLFTPKNASSFKSPAFSINALNELVLMLLKLFDSFTEGEPYDLVEVASDKVLISIRIR